MHSIRNHVVRIPFEEVTTKISKNMDRPNKNIEENLASDRYEYRSMELATWNLPSVHRKALTRLRPFIELAYNKVGALSPSNKTFQLFSLHISPHSF